MSKLHKWQIRIFYTIWMLILVYFAKPPFTFLLLNTFLAFIPIEFSFHIDSNKPKSSFLFWILIIIWMLFYPNTPYLLTDLFHLSLLNPYGADGLLRLNNFMWLNFTLLIISTFVSVIIGMWGLIKVAKSITDRYKLNKFYSYIIAIILTILSSIGIFIGRFLRIHTVYLFLTPTIFIKPFLNMLGKDAFLFMAVLTFIQLIILWFLHIISHPNNNKKETS